MKKLFYLFFLVISALFLCQCSDNDNPGGDDKPDNGPNQKTIVFSYDNFSTENDVTIDSPDTSLISVSKDFLREYKIEIKLNNDTIPLVVWKSMNTIPFIRKVVQANDQGDRLQLVTIQGDIACVFPNNEFILDTKPYIDKSKEKFKTWANGQQIVNDERYTDNEGVIHPIMYMLDDVYEKVDENGNFMQINENGDFITDAVKNEVRCVTVEDLLASDVDFNVINFDRNFGDVNVNLNADKNVVVYARNIHLRAQAGMRINMKTFFFSLRNFETISYGDFGGASNLGIELRGKKQKDGEKEILKLCNHTAFYMIGYIPIAVTTKVGAKLGASASVSGKIQVGTAVDFSMGYKLGCAYTAKRGWYPVTEGHFESNVEPTLQGSAAVDAKASVGLYLYTDVSLSGFGGPGLKFGPQASALASLGIMEEKLKGKCEVGLSVAGDVHAKLKLLGFELASWKYPFTIWEGPKKTYEFEMPL